MRFSISAAALLALAAARLASGGDVQILTNQLGYDSFGPKRAVIRGTADDQFTSFSIRRYPEGTLVFRGTASPGTGVDKWRNWRFWTLDFGDLQAEGTYVIESGDAGGQAVRSLPFRVQPNLLDASPSPTFCSISKDSASPASSTKPTGTSLFGMRTESPLTLTGVGTTPAATTASTFRTWISLPGSIRSRRP